MNQTKHFVSEFSSMFIMKHYISKSKDVVLGLVLYVLRETECYFFTDKLIVNRLSMVELEQENFDRLLPFETFNMTYDWKSISHYSNRAFRKPFTLGYTLETKVS